jgi:hypothetical protein
MPKKKFQRLTDPLSDLPDSVHFPLIKRSQNNPHRSFKNIPFGPNRKIESKADFSTHNFLESDVFKQ